MTPDKLRDLRERAGLSQREAARVCGITHGVYVKYERWSAVEKKRERLLGLGFDPQKALSMSVIGDKALTRLQAYAAGV